MKFHLISGERELSQYTLEAEDLKISKLPENNFSTVSTALQVDNAMVVRDMVGLTTLSGI